MPDTPEIASLRRSLKAAGARPSPPEQTHITLRFLGDVDPSRVDGVEASVAEAVRGVDPFPIRLSGVGAFPNTRRPSVVWIGAEPADVLTGMADRLAAGLASRGIPFDDKPFRAHVTVGRCRDGLRSPGIFEECRGKTFAGFQCSEVLVVRSVLEPSGARHSVLRRVPLGRFCGENI